MNDRPPPLPVTRLLGLCGSLRAASSNHAALTAFGTLLPTEVDWAIADSLADLPHFNPDNDISPDAVPAAVQRFRAAVRAADALVVSSPEYAHGLPGSFKNALDWLVSEPDFPGKPVALIHFSRGSTFALDQLREILRTMSAHVVDAATCRLAPGTNRVDATALLDDPMTHAALTASATALCAAIRQPITARPAHRRQRLGLVSLVVRDYDEALAFFVGRLGFDLIEDTAIPAQNKRWVVVAPPGASGAHLLLAQASAPAQRDRIGDQTGGRVFLFLETDDFERDYVRLRDLGIHFARPPQAFPYGTVAVFEDLYGNLWDLIEPRRA